VANTPPRNVNIKGQPHMLAYITPEESGILKALGGAGKPGPMGIPSFYMDDTVGDTSGTYSGGDDSGNEAQDSFDFYAGSDDRPTSVLTDPATSDTKQASDLIAAGTNPVTNVFDLGGGVGDFAFGTAQSPYTTIGSKFSPGGVRSVPTFLNPQLAEMYKQQEMARTGIDLDKNPYVDSIFNTIAKKLGTSVDRTSDLVKGSPTYMTKERVQEINDLRARQAFGLPSLKTGESYTSKDFEVGRDTQQGMVKELPIGGLESLARAYLPGGFLIPRGAAPEQSQMYRDAMAKAKEAGILGYIGDSLSDISKLFTGLFSGDVRATTPRFDDGDGNTSVVQTAKPEVKVDRFDPEGESFLPSNLDSLLQQNRDQRAFDIGYDEDFAPEKPFTADLSSIDEGLENVQRGTDEVTKTFTTTTPNFNLPGFSSRSMSKAEADRIKNRLNY